MEHQIWFTISVSIICGILSNIGTPMVTRWSRRFVNFTRSSSLKGLEKDLFDVRHLQSDQADRQLYFWKQVFLIAGAIALGLCLEKLPSISMMSMGPLSWAAGRAYWTVELVKSLRRFESFEKESLLAIAGLKLKLASVAKRTDDSNC